jgi:acetylornithine deacetylase
MKNIEILTQEAISLLEALIETPSFSTEERKQPFYSKLV